MRPKIEKKRQRINVIKACLNDEEMKILKKKLEQSRYKNISIFVRDLILNREIKSSYDVEMINEFRKIGTNLNQISHVLNSKDRGKLYVNARDRVWFMKNFGKFMQEFKSIYYKLL